MEEELVVLAELVVKNGKVYELHRKYISTWLWNLIKRAPNSAQEGAVERELELVGRLYKLVSLNSMMSTHSRGLKLGLLKRMTKEEADALSFRR